MSISIKNINDLEKKYMEKITDVVTSRRFIKSLQQIERYIQANYESIRKYSAEENKVKVGVERIIRFYFYTEFDVKNVYPSPLSADLAIELEDVILNIDAKTINMITNDGDDNSIHFQKNQITFENNPFFKQKIKGYQFSGAPFPPRMNSYYNNKPILTYFITINYEDKPNTSTFRLVHMSTCSVPHKDIVRQEYDNDILENLKSWGYIGMNEAKKSVGLQYKPIIGKKDKPNPKWIPFNMKGSGDLMDSWLDTSLDQPYEEIGGKCVRKYLDKAFRIVSYGISARISKERLLDRYDSNGDIWKGVNTIKNVFY